MRPSNNMENKILSDSMYVIRTTSGIQSRPHAFNKSRFKGKTGKEIPESSRLEFFEKFSANNFALSDAEDNTSGWLNRGGIADLPLLRTLLAICQKSQEPSFWEVMDSFVLAYASLAASEALLQ